MSRRSSAVGTAIRRCCLAVLVCAITTGGPAGAATIDDAIADVSAGVFIQEGTGQDTGSLQQVVADFADRERLVIAVFAGGLEGTPEDGAFAVLDALGVDTVILFTPDDIAAASTVHTPSEVDGAFRVAGDAALDRDAAVASRALMEALTDEPTPVWVWLLVVAAVIGLVALAGLLLDRRRRRRIADRLFEQARAGFQSRLQTVADLILDLDASVTLADDRQMSEDLTRSTGIYRDVQWSFERAGSADQIARLEAAITPAEDILARLAARIG